MSGYANQVAISRAEYLTNQGDYFMTMQTDPVCGMQIEESAAAGKSEYQGQTFYFCSAACKTRFDEEPEKYVNQTEKI